MAVRSHNRLAVGGGIAAVLLSAAGSASAGPNVTLREVLSFVSYPPVGTTRAYAIGSDTCNVGNQNLLWTNRGTPGLAQNMYRLHGGRIEQIGQGWVKHACCAGAGAGCGLSCNGSGGSVLGAGCKDVYGAGFNGGQGGLGPRSGINAYTGTFTGPPSVGTIPSTARRIQVQQNDLTAASFPGALYFVEGVYVASDETPADKLDNATYKRVTVSAAFDLTGQGVAREGRPAIYAWADHGLGANVPDPSVTIRTLDVPGEGRFFVGSKATELGQGRWRYEYAVFNLNSDVAGGSFSIPLGNGAIISDITFRDVPYETGEGYDNADWVVQQTTGALTWRSPQTFQENPNSNALRWGTMYNFGFTANRPPADRDGVVSFFKPINPGAMPITLTAPAGCAADMNADGVVSVQDFFNYLDLYFAGLQAADRNGDTAITVQDIFIYLNDFFTPCG